MARSSGWMRIECLFHRVLRMLRKSASRIVAHVTSSRSRCALRQYFSHRFAANRFGWHFFNVCSLHGLCLGFDGGGTKTECVLMDRPERFWPGALLAHRTLRALARNWPHVKKSRKRADLSCKKLGSREVRSLR